MKIIKQAQLPSYLDGHWTCQVCGTVVEFESASDLPRSSMIYDCEGGVCVDGECPHCQKDVTEGDRYQTFWQETEA